LLPSMHGEMGLDHRCIRWAKYAPISTRTRDWFPVEATALNAGHAPMLWERVAQPKRRSTRRSGHLFDNRGNSCRPEWPSTRVPRTAQGVQTLGDSIDVLGLQTSLSNPANVQNPPGTSRESGVRSGSSDVLIIRKQFLRPNNCFKRIWSWLFLKNSAVPPFSGQAQAKFIHLAFIHSIPQKGAR
jgi:hypothetical protein